MAGLKLGKNFLIGLLGRHGKEGIYLFLDVGDLLGLGINLVKRCLKLNAKLLVLGNKLIDQSLKTVVARPRIGKSGGSCIHVGTRDRGKRTQTAGPQQRESCSNSKGAT